MQTHRMPIALVVVAAVSLHAASYCSAQTPSSTRGQTAPQVQRPSSHPRGPEASWADRVESTLARNPLASAWSSLRNQQPDGARHYKSRAEFLRQDRLARVQPAGPASPDLLISMAKMSEQQGHIDEARRQYQQVLAVAPQHVDALIHLARLEDRQGQLQQAERLYFAATQSDPQHAGALNDLGLCLARQGRLAESADVLGRAIALRPEKALYRNNLATVLVEAERDEQALSHLVAAHGPAVANYNMGHLLIQRGREAAAPAYFQTALQIDPDLEQAQVALAKLHVQGDNVEVADRNSSEASQAKAHVGPQNQSPAVASPGNHPQLIGPAGNPLSQYRMPQGHGPLPPQPGSAYQARRPQGPSLRHLPPVTSPRQY